MKNFLNTLLSISGLILTLSWSSPVHAQPVSFETSSSLIPPVIGNIFSGNELKGYYLYYYEGRSPAKNTIYQLKILNMDLQVLGATPVELDKYLHLLESTSDGSSIVFKYYHSREKKLEYHQYDLEGNRISLASRQVRSGKEHQFLVQFQGPAYSTNTYQPSMIPIPNRGFVDQSQTHTKKAGFWLDYYSGGEKPTWDYVSNPESQMEIYAAHLATTPNLLLYEVSESSGSRRSGTRFSLLALQLEDGQPRFELPLQSAQYALAPTSAYYDAQKQIIHLLGQYYLADQASNANESNGFFVLQLDEEGDILSEKYTSHREDLQKWLPEKALKRYEAMGNLYIHNLFPWQDDRIIAVGETYRKGVSALGVIDRVIPDMTTNTSSLAEISVGDLLIFEFAADFSLLHVELIEKSTSHRSLPYGSLWANEDRLAHAIKQSGGFDYRYTLLVPEQKWFAVGYQDYERIKNAKNRIVFGQVSRHEDEELLKATVSMGYITDLFKGIKTVHPAQPGFLMVAEHNRGEKELSLELRAIN